MPELTNWVDVLDRPPAFVVLAKENRLQIIARPSPEQLRRRGKRGWSVVATIAGDGQAVPPALQRAVQRALARLAAGPSLAGEKVNI